MAKCKVIDFKFINNPIFRERTPVEGMSKKQLESIEKLPFRLIKNCTFTITVSVDKKEYEFKATVSKGFCYNMADIPLLLQPISYDKTSPFVKNASFIHDYLLDRRVELYKNWKMKELGITPSNFRDITSAVFGLILKQNAVEDKKADAMALAVNIYQSLLFLDWAKCGKDIVEKKEGK
jgi:hypothetical protein